jgi:Fic family protein
MMVRRRLELALQSPREITLSGDIRELLNQVDEALGNLNARRPFPAEMEERIRTLFLPDRVTSTLNIEGISVTRRQTLAVMDAMAVGSYSSSGDREIANVLRADELVYHAAESNEAITPDFIRSINALVLDGLAAGAGAYREQNVEITGAAFTPPDIVDVPILIRQICDEFPKADFEHPIVQAAWLHNQFTYVHPFIDGNGREARLLQDFCLIRRSMYPVGISASKRDDYYKALQLADEGEWDDLVEMIALSQLAVIGKIDSATREPERRQAWITQLSKAASAKKTGTLHKRYLIWRERMQRVQDAFAIATREIDEGSDVVGVTLRSYDAIEFEKWKRIGDYGSAERTWAFSLLFFLDGSPFYKVIAFYRRHRSSPSDPYPAADNAIALCITGHEAKSAERPNFLQYEDAHIHLREILFVEDDLICYEQELPATTICPSELLTADDVVRKFFEDVFYRKAGLAN